MAYTTWNKGNVDTVIVCASGTITINFNACISKICNSL